MNEMYLKDIHSVMNHFMALPAHVVLTTHMQPDADAIGSVCALKGVLKHLGVDSRIVNESPTPENLRFLPWAESIEVYDSGIHDDILRTAQVVVCCDLNDLRRTGRMAAELTNHQECIVMIDHHTDPRPFYSSAFHDVLATSTAELIYRLTKVMLPNALTADVATNIYAGVMSDTGSFRFPRVTAYTHRMIADLLEAGADPVEIYNRMNNTWSIAKMRLLGAVLSTMKLHCDGALCTLTVPFSMIQSAGSSVEELDGMVHYTMSIAGVRCGVLIAERSEEKEIKLSFRSKGDFVVNELAAGFGGGGHIYAAGARTRMGSLSEVEAEVVTRVQQALVGASYNAAR